MSPAEGLAAIVEGIPGLLGSFTLRIGGWGTSNTEVVFQDSGGRPPEVAIAIDYPTVQLLFRGLKYSETYKKAADIKAKLHALEQKSGGEPNDFYPELVACLVRGDITPLGQDDKNRFMFSLNFNLIIAPIETGNRD